MKIAIHNNLSSFSDRWIEYCKEKSIPYKLVNCYNSDIIDHLKDCDALMWHFHHRNYKDVLFAKQLIFSIKQAGKMVFPDFNTSWHFNDKVGQKYLLESIGAPLVPSYVFYSKTEAIEFVNLATFPKVFKLRGGASSANVRLVKNKKEAIRLINKAFGKGFSQFDRVAYFKERYIKFKEGKDSIIGVFKGIGRLFIPTEFAKMHAPEKGYVYFQDFIPNNNYDIRVIVIGKKAFAIKRMTRQNDFRASGSGVIIYKKEEINEKCVQIAFDINKKLSSQSIAFDFVLDKTNNPLVVEVSYGFDVHAYDACPGYWDSEMNWHLGKFNPQVWMIENLISSIKKYHANLHS